MGPKTYEGSKDNSLLEQCLMLYCFFFLQDASKVPDWLKINKGVVPDFVCRNPKVSW